jgi:DNA-binding NarL/FixJ family response regulator
MKSQRVLLVDRFELFRDGLRVLLEAEGWPVVGEAGTAQEALRLIAELKPDVTIVEPDIPDMGGAEAVRQLGRRSPGTRIVVLARISSDEDADSARRLGTAAYLSKDCEMEELCAAMHTPIA